MSISIDMKSDFIFKILSLGDSEVGKTSILVRYSDGKFDTNGLPTLGVDLMYKQIIIDNISIRLDLWDTAGEERFRNITKNYYKGAHGVIFIFNVAKKETFRKLKDWIDEVKEYVSPDTEMIIAGNKADLEDEREVGKEMIEDFSKKFNINYFEVSAKSGDGINEMFNFLIKKILTKIKNDVAQSENDAISSRNNSIILKPSISRDKKKHNCQC